MNCNVCVCVCARAYVCVCARMCMCVCMCVSVRARMCMYCCVCVRACACVCVSTRVWCVCVCVCVNTGYSSTERQFGHGVQSYPLCPQPACYLPVRGWRQHVAIHTHLARVRQQEGRVQVTIQVHNINRPFFPLIKHYSSSRVQLTAQHNFLS